MMLIHTKQKSENSVKQDMRCYTIEQYQNTHIYQTLYPTNIALSRIYSDTVYIYTKILSSVIKLPRIKVA